MSLLLREADNQGGIGAAGKGEISGGGVVVGGNLRQTGLWAREVAKRDKLALDNRGPYPPGG